MSTKLIFAGDSITGYSDLANYLKFSHIVDLMLEAKFGEGRVAVLNRGFGGDTTRKLLLRLERDVLAEQPDIVVLLIGGNDAGEGVPRETTAENLATILGALHAIGTKVLLLQYHLLLNSENAETAWKHLASNNDLIASASTIGQVHLVPMQPYMQGALDGHPLETLVSAHDGVHLNPGGELVFARSIFNELMVLGWIPIGG